jgi:hypothetical protein
MSNKGRPRQNPDICIEDDCNRRAVCKERCDRHYRLWRRDTGIIPRKYERQKGKTCYADGCDREAERKGLCATHYARWRKNGDLETRRAPNGAGHFRKDHGYWVTTRNGKTQHLHRHVMEEKLGRALRPGESVHHINGVRTDNRPENLELMVSSHPRGQRPTDLVEWAYQILHAYEDEVLAGMYD